jgi:hypothetical protein
VFDGAYSTTQVVEDSVQIARNLPTFCWPAGRTIVTSAFEQGKERTQTDSGWLDINFNFLLYPKALQT